MELLKTIDYSDCFEREINISPPPALRDIVYHFFTKWPQWVNTLFVIRNILVLPFGLQGGKDEKIFSLPKPKFIWQQNGKIDFFTIADLTENEVILIIKDKHLDACLIFTRIISDGNTTILAKTDVSYNNAFGWWYFNLIKPFHMLIVKAQLNKTIKSLQK